MPSSNPRLLAEDVVRHYVSSLNFEHSHSGNIQRHFRPLVLAVTKHILYSPSRGDDEFVDRENEILFAERNWSDSIVKKPSTLDSDLSEDDTVNDDTDNTTNGGKVLSVRSMARMEAFLGSCTLAFPSDPILPAVADSHSVRGKSQLSNLLNKLTFVGGDTTPVVGKSVGSETIESDSNNINVASSLSTALSGYSVPSKEKLRQTKKRKNRRRYPQIDAQRLADILALYIRNLYRVRTHQSECVLSLEPHHSLTSRVQTLLSSLISTAGTVGSVRFFLTKLLTCLTLELLAVESLSSELESAIRSIVLEYEHVTSFASLAFLSSPNESAETKLLPLLMGYVDYLKKDCYSCVEQCELEYVLSKAIDPGTRTVFKTVNFTSIGHLLKVCGEHHEHLENIVIRPLGVNFDMWSAPLERVTTIPPGNNQYSPSAIIHSFDLPNGTTANINDSKIIKQALRDLRREVITVNGHILPPVRSLKELVKLLRETLNSRPLKLKENFIGRGQRNNLRRSKHRSTNGSTAVGAEEIASSNVKGSESDSSNSSVPTGLTSGSDTDFISSGNEGDIDGAPSQIEEAIPSNGGAVRTTRRRSFNVNAIDIMTRRLLIAASRTGIGGDAYFVVRDIFGGEDVDVVTSETLISQDYMPRRVSDCTIELIVRLSSIVIKCHGKFDVYAKELVGECEPLIKLYTTSTEIIQLQEVRAEPPSVQDVPSDEDGNTPTVLVLKEKISEMTGCRTVAIEPARYEKVENWKTFS